MAHDNSVKAKAKPGREVLLLTVDKPQHGSAQAPNKSAAHLPDIVAKYIDASPAIAHKRRCKEVRPEYARIRRAKVARQFSHCAQHRFIIGRAFQNGRPISYITALQGILKGTSCG